MKNSKKTVTTLLTAAVLLLAVFAAGRYGWKLLGFRTCQGAGIESVEVREKTVKIKGFSPARSRMASADTTPKNRTGRSMWALPSARFSVSLKPAILM